MRQLIFFFLSLFTSVGFSQNFNFAEGDTLIRTFEINDFTQAHTKINNLLDEIAIYQWELITFDHPFEWEFTLCDLPFCYTEGETTGTMYPAGALSDEAFLAVSIEATHPDTGFYQIEVWNQTLPDEKDTLTIIMIATPAFSSLKEDIDTPAPHYRFTDGAQELHLFNPGKKAVEFKLYNDLGQLVLSTRLTPFSEKHIRTPHIKNGIYTTKMGNNTGEFETGRTYIP